MPIPLLRCDRPPGPGLPAHVHLLPWSSRPVKRGLARQRRRKELERQRSLTLQGVERTASVLVLPHPERADPEVRRLTPNPETEDTAMRVVMEHEAARGRQIFDVHRKSLGYDVTSLDLTSGDLRLIEVKGLAAASGTILLRPNERRVAEDKTPQRQDVD